MPDTMVENPADTLARNNVKTVREFINMLIEFPNDATLSMNYQQSNEMLPPPYYRSSYRMMTIRDADGSNGKIIWEISMSGFGDIVTTSYYSLPSEGKKQLQGLVTVRDMINALIGENPDDVLGIIGSIYNLRLCIGKRNERGNRIHLNESAVWAL